MKISDHHVRSPLLNVNRACQTCHRWSEDELRNRVHTIQDRTYQVRNVAMDALMALIADIKSAKRAGASDADLQAARQHQRRGQFLLDFIEAENSMGFHADQEAVRVLALSLDETRRGQAALPGSMATPGSRTETRPTLKSFPPTAPHPTAAIRRLSPITAHRRCDHAGPERLQIVDLLWRWIAHHTH
jgi:nitrite reductase (cytochrome c-552)